MRSVREKGVKVLMTGQGGDETLGGYHKYYLYLFAELLMKLKVGAAVSEIGAYKAVKPGHKGLAGDIARIMLSYAMPAWMKSLLSGMSLKKPLLHGHGFF
jgi:asparagine synthase (glutamine-hydrolysing)